MTKLQKSREKGENPEIFRVYAETQIPDMADEALLQPPTESASPKSSLLAEVSNAATRAFVVGFSSCACCAFVLGCIAGYSSPTQLSIMRDLNLSVADYSFFGSILTVGQIIGAFMCGRLTDLFGRVYTMWITNILYIAGWLGIAFAKGAWLLDLGRFFHGVAIGIASYLGPIYIAEITPRNLRGAASSLSQLCMVIGISIVYALGTVVTWRNLALIGSVPCLVTLPLLFFVPESPRWLAKMARYKEFEAVLLHLRGAEADVSDEAAEILEYTDGIEQQTGDGFFKLFQRKYAFSLMIGVVLVALPQLGGVNGFLFYTDAIFSSAGISSDVGFMTSSLVQLLTGILGTFLVDVSGRRLLLLVSQAGTLLGCIVMAISFFLQERHYLETGTPMLALASVLVYIGANALGMSSIPWIIASEIYPMDVKGSAGTICNLAGAISSWIVAYFFSFLLQWSSTGTFLIFASVCGFGVVFIAKLVPETKGKSLEEIQALLTASG
ncbi:PREDICTED: sugar transporter ERD6-like 15 isoform X1 [Tarenaya hassleriana]|uniref:sugar transporter ERD6-like 15 isoform X1 n=1 Tax=Tarenaya hassleriana TaxID=28532 RepID=UPI00053C5093|nr:PREDICTED: sugar transporter ERD6-like 15 isoform X1 [Tarenaya hassleriana]